MMLQNSAEAPSSNTPGSTTPISAKDSMHASSATLGSTQNMCSCSHV